MDGTGVYVLLGNESEAFRLLRYLKLCRWSVETFFHRLFDLKNTGRPFYPIANYIRSNLGIVIAAVPICTSSCWNGDFFVSFETFFFIWNQFSSKRHTQRFHTHALHMMKTEWSQFSIVTVIRGAIENKTKFFSAGRWPRPYAEFSQQSNWLSDLKWLKMCQLKCIVNERNMG